MLATLPVEAHNVLADPDLITRERARRSLSEFGMQIDELPSPTHIGLLCKNLEAVERGDIPRLMVFMPPGGAKSTWTSKLFAAWCRGKHPDWPIIAASYGTKLSKRFGRRARDTIQRRRYREIFPSVRLSGNSGAADEWAVISGEDDETIGEYAATSIDGTITGLRAMLLLVDDPVKGISEAQSETVRDGAWDWWRTDMRTRMLPGCRIVLIMTRWHHDDIAGRILPEDFDGSSGWYKSRDGEDWYVLAIQAEAEENDILGRLPGEWYWPDFYPPDAMLAQKQALGPIHWNSLYQQRPSPEEGSYFQKEWFQVYDPADLPRELRKYGASDYAVTGDGGDFTELGVCGMDSENNIWMLDWWQGQKTADVWVREVINLATSHEVEEWAEEKGQIEKSVGPFMNRMMDEQSAYFYRRGYTSATDKPTRARSFQALMANGKVRWPRNAPWYPRVMHQMLQFPNAKHDDAVDVCSLIGRIVDRMIKARKEVEPENPYEAKPMTFNDALKIAQRRNRR